MGRRPTPARCRPGVRSLAVPGFLAWTLLVCVTALISCGGDPWGSRSTPAPAARNHDLARDETLGGHTLSRHVGLTDEALRERLRREQGIAAASTYFDRTTAERVVADVLARAGTRLERWRDRKGPRPNLVLDHDGDPARPVGRSLRRGDSRVRDAHDAVVVLKWHGEAGYFVLTSYPEVRR